MSSYPKWDRAGKSAGEYRSAHWCALELRVAHVRSASLPEHPHYALSTVCDNVGCWRNHSGEVTVLQRSWLDMMMDVRDTVAPAQPRSAPHAEGQSGESSSSRKRHVLDLISLSFM